jgi:hypothetical protein
MGIMPGKGKKMGDFHDKYYGFVDNPREDDSEERSAKSRIKSFIQDVIDADNACPSCGKTLKVATVGSGLGCTVLYCSCGYRS